MCNCGVGDSTSEKHAKEQGFESYTAKIINNYFPLAAQENNYSMKLLVNADVWKAIP
jgi:hypothetical protein